MLVTDLTIDPTALLPIQTVDIGFESLGLGDYIQAIHGISTWRVVDSRPYGHWTHVAAVLVCSFTIANLGRVDNFTVHASNPLRYLRPWTPE